MKPSKTGKIPGPHQKLPPITHPPTLDCVHVPFAPMYGQEIACTISYSNPNARRMTSLKLVFDMSLQGNPPLDLTSASDNGYLQGNSIVWDALPPLNRGDAGFVSFRLRAPIGMDPGGMISCPASVTLQSLQAPPATLWHMTDVIAWEDLNFVVSCPKTVHRGQTFQYVITMINNCEIPVTSIRIDAALSTHVTFIDASAPESACLGTYVPGWHGIAWEPCGGLGPGESQSITAKVKVNANAPLGNDVIDLNFYRFLSDESVGIGQDVSSSVMLMLNPLYHSGIIKEKKRS